MNWRGWVSGMLVVAIGGSIATVNALVVQLNPIPPEWKIFMIAFPIFMTPLATFLMHSPIPGSTGIPADVITGIKDPLPPSK
jgi:uncharacterized protein (DUF983 family)